MYVLPKHPFKKFLQWVCKFNRNENNYFIRLLLGKKVSDEEIDGYKPRYGSRWGSRMNITSRTENRPMAKEHLSDYNYDKDLLYAINR